MRSLACSALAAVCVSLIFASTAPASRGQSTIFDLGGQALSVSTAQRENQLDQVKALGADTVRILVTWRSIAPEPNSSTRPSNFDPASPSTYPGTGWGPIDDLVRGAKARDLRVLMTPSAPVPNWASASGESSLLDPDPEQFEKFVTALGKRYDGTYDPAFGGLGFDPLPRVSFFSIYNEPNLELFLRPQYRGRQSISGKLYRELFLAAQRGLAASGHGDDPLLIGETSPGPGRGGTAPIDFMRGVFCLNRDFKKRGGCEPIDATGWAAHPYDPFDPPFRTSRGLINVNSIGKLARALKRAAKAGATTHKLPLYVTEFGVESVPDRKFGVSQRRQAEYIGIAEYLLYKMPIVKAFSQYLMQDDGGGLAFSFQTGLRLNNGRAKLAYDAFPNTLVAQRRSKRSRTVRIWGHIRPGQGSRPVVVQFRDPGKPAKGLKSLQTDAGGYFSFRTPFRDGRMYRVTSQLSDRSLQGPFQRVYAFR
jgi:hypothetical protein